MKRVSNEEMHRLPVAWNHEQFNELYMQMRDRLLRTFETLRELHGDAVRDGGVREFRVSLETVQGASFLCVCQTLEVDDSVPVEVP